MPMCIDKIILTNNKNTYKSLNSYKSHSGLKDRIKMSFKDSLQMCKVETTRKTTHSTVYRVIDEKAHSPLFFSLVFGTQRSADHNQDMVLPTHQGI